MHVRCLSIRGTEDIVLIISGSTGTKLGALRSVTRPIDEMTVKELCRETGISRQTFYTYFESKYDIAYWYMELCETATLNGFRSGEEWRRALDSYAALMYEYRDNLQYAFTMTPHDIEILPRFERLVKLFSDVFQRAHGLLTERDTRCICQYVFAFRDSVISWCLDGMELDPPDFSELCYDSIPHHLLSLLSGDVASP